MNCFPCRSLVRPLTVRNQNAIMYDRDMDYLRARSPTPPLPPRNPNRPFSSHQQPHLTPLDASSELDLDLLPKPLFSTSPSLTPKADIPSLSPLRQRPGASSNRHALASHSLSADVPSQRSSLTMSSSRVSSFAPSQRTSIVSLSPSTPRTQASSSPASRPPSLAYPSLPSLWPFSPTAPHPEPLPMPSLKRRKTGRRETLRNSRPKDSADGRHRIYDSRMFASKWMGLSLG